MRSTAAAPEPEEHRHGLTDTPTPKPYRLPEDFFFIPERPALESLLTCPTCEDDILPAGGFCPRDGTRDWSETT